MPLGNGWASFKTKNPNYIIVRVLVRIIGVTPYVFLHFPKLNQTHQTLIFIDFNKDLNILD